MPATTPRGARTGQVSGPSSAARVQGERYAPTYATTLVKKGHTRKRVHRVGPLSGALPLPWGVQIAFARVTAQPWRDVRNFGGGLNRMSRQDNPAQPSSLNGEPTIHHSSASDSSRS